MDSRFPFSDWHIFYRRIIGLDQLDLNPLKNLTRGCLVDIQDFNTLESSVTYSKVSEYYKYEQKHLYAS